MTPPDEQSLLAKANVKVGQYYTIDGERFETDVLTTCNNRLCYFSVTTSANEAICKEKMFEAQRRAEQIGGLLARTCVVCLTDNQTVAHCMKSVGMRGRHSIVGTESVEQWLNGNAQTLREFLTIDKERS